MTSNTLNEVRARLTTKRKPRGIAAARGGAVPALTSIHAIMAAGVLGLVMLAIPRIGAQAILLPVYKELDALKTGAAIPTDRLDAARQALARARALDPSDGHLATDLALTELLEADRTKDNVRHVWLGDAIGALEQGLAESPADAFGWARLAGAKLAYEGKPSPSMLAALRMSYVTGLYADKIMPFRASLTLFNWDGLDAELQGYAKRELVYLWERKGPWEENQLPLIKLVCASGKTGLLAQALIEMHRSLEDFDKLYETHLSPDGCATLAATKP